MNLPNRLTLLRISLIPVVVLLMYIDHPVAQALALLMFILAAFTDFLDGYLARRNKIVTNLGKFLDPVADKLLVLSTMIGLCGLNRFPAWACIIILFREIAVDGLRMIAVEQRRVIPAGWLGKIKTVLQLATIVLYFLRNRPFGSFPMDRILLGITLLMTIWSGVDYFLKNREVLTGTKPTVSP